MKSDCCDLFRAQNEFLSSSLEIALMACMLPQLIFGRTAGSVPAVRLMVSNVSPLTGRMAQSPVRHRHTKMNLRTLISSGLEMPPDQNAFQMVSILLRSSPVSMGILSVSGAGRRGLIACVGGDDGSQSYLRRGCNCTPQGAG